jgi:hypothetical protein
MEDLQRQLRILFRGKVLEARPQYYWIDQAVPLNTLDLCAGAFL